MINKAVKIIVLFFTFFLFQNCLNNKRESVKTVGVKSNELKKEQLLIFPKEDTILERNNPDSLDLSKHQIFIDTTRSSKFYKDLINWSESKWDIESIKSSVEELSKDFKLKNIEISNFPNHFISLRKLEGNFILYDRCDGIDPRFEIRKGFFIFYGPLESHADLISKIRINSEKRIELELKTHKTFSSDEKSFLIIKKIDDYIYKMEYKSENYNRLYYITTIENIRKFDLVVNNCPSMKMSEFKKFDGYIKSDRIEVEDLLN